MDTGKQAVTSEWRNPMAFPASVAELSEPYDVEVELSGAAVGVSRRPPNVLDTTPVKPLEFQRRVLGEISDDAGAISRHALRKQLSGPSEVDCSPQDILAYLLGNICDPAEAARHAHALLERFASVGAVLGATYDTLNSVIASCENGAALIRALHRLVSLSLQEPMENQCLINNPAALEKYLKVTLSHETTEVVRLLLLNTRNALIKDVLHSRGSVNQVSVYPYEIIRTIIQENASALIIVHNHPSGDPTPSADDWAMTKSLALVLKEIGVTLHDHVVVGRRSCVSMRSIDTL